MMAPLGLRAEKGVQVLMYRTANEYPLFNPTQDRKQKMTGILK